LTQDAGVAILLHSNPRLQPVEVEFEGNEINKREFYINGN
jgi:hypothetical protein